MENESSHLGKEKRETPQTDGENIFADHAKGSTSDDYSIRVHNFADYQVIPGNDQNTSSTNQKTAGSNLERTS